MNINSNDLEDILAHALATIKGKMGESYSIEKVNLAELHRITGISRSKLRRLKKNSFAVKPNGNKGKSPRNLLFQDTRAQLMIISERMSQILKLSLKDFKESAIQEAEPLSNDILLHIKIWFQHQERL